MADKPTFTFQGEQIEFVPLDEFTTDEAVTLYNWSALTLDKVMDLDGFHPGFTAGLIHVSLARAKPTLSERAVRDAVGKMKLVDMLAAFETVTVESDALPPPTGTSSENATSGKSSNGTGDASQENTEVPGFGMPGSRMFAPASDPVTSEDSPPANSTSATTSP